MKKLPNVIKSEGLIERWRKTVPDKATLFQFALDGKINLVCVNPPGITTKLSPYRYYPAWCEVMYLPKTHINVFRKMTSESWHFFWGMVLNKLDPESIKFGASFTRFPPISTQYLEALLREGHIRLDVVSEEYSDGAKCSYIASPARTYDIGDLGVLREEVTRFESVMMISPEESPERRHFRLQKAFEEEVGLHGERGALTRLAKKEGIRRQTLTAILNRKYKKIKTQD